MAAASVILVPQGASIAGTVPVGNFARKVGAEVPNFPAPPGTASTFVNGTRLMSKGHTTARHGCDRGTPCTISFEEAIKLINLDVDVRKIAQETQLGVLKN